MRSAPCRPRPRACGRPAVVEQGDHALAEQDALVGGHVRVVQVLQVPVFASGEVHEVEHDLVLDDAAGGLRVRLDLEEDAAVRGVRDDVCDPERLGVAEADLELDVRGTESLHRISRRVELAPASLERVQLRAGGLHGALEDAVEGAFEAVTAALRADVREQSQQLAPIVGLPEHHVVQRRRQVHPLRLHARDLLEAGQLAIRKLRELSGEPTPVRADGQLVQLLRELVQPAGAQAIALQRRRRGGPRARARLVANGLGRLAALELGVGIGCVLPLAGARLLLGLVLDRHAIAGSLRRHPRLRGLDVGERPIAEVGRAMGLALVVQPLHRPFDLSRLVSGQDERLEPAGLVECGDQRDGLEAEVEEAEREPGQRRLLGGERSGQVEVGVDEGLLPAVLVPLLVDAVDRDAHCRHARRNRERRPSGRQQRHDRERKRRQLKQGRVVVRGVVDQVLHDARPDRSRGDEHVRAGERHDGRQGEGVQLPLLDQVQRLDDAGHLRQHLHEDRVHLLLHGRRVEVPEVDLLELAAAAVGGEDGVSALGPDPDLVELRAGGRQLGSGLPRLVVARGTGVGRALEVGEIRLLQSLRDRLLALLQACGPLRQLPTLRHFGGVVDVRRALCVLDDDGSQRVDVLARVQPARGPAGRRAGQPVGVQDLLNPVPAAAQHPFRVQARLPLELLPEARSLLFEELVVAVDPLGAVVELQRLP